MWVEQLIGFKEDRDLIYQNLEIQGVYLHSKVNGQKYRYGQLEIPPLANLRRTTLTSLSKRDGIQVREIVADVQALHRAHPDAVFQVASQFNLLEMIGPHITPEAGLGIYAHDLTQGPACAIACGAGTIYRNYFVPLGDQIGQTSSQQINCLDDFEAALRSPALSLWDYRNGYVLPTSESLKYINDYITKLDEKAYDQLKSKIKVGVQWHTEVTLAGAGHTVTQVYASALPIAYTSLPAPGWKPFARMLLEASYEAIFWIALKQFQINGNKKLFLTLIGGGAFGNPQEWVVAAIQSSIQQFAAMPLEVYLVSYRKSNPALERLLTP